MATTDRRLSVASVAASQTGGPPPASPLQPAVTAGSTGSRPLSGFLFKQADHFRDWRPRYFTLESGALFYYKPNEKKHSGVVVLQNCAVRDDGSKLSAKGKKFYSFTIVHSDSSKEWHLSAEREEDALIWINALRLAAQQADAKPAEQTPSASDGAATARAQIPAELLAAQNSVHEFVAALVEQPEGYLRTHKTAIDSAGVRVAVAPSSEGLSFSTTLLPIGADAAMGLLTQPTLLAQCLSGPVQLEAVTENSARLKVRAAPSTHAAITAAVVAQSAGLALRFAVVAALFRCAAARPLLSATLLATAIGALVSGSVSPFELFTGWTSTVLVCVAVALFAFDTYRTVFAKRADGDDDEDNNAAAEDEEAFCKSALVFTSTKQLGATQGDLVGALVLATPCSAPLPEDADYVFSYRGALLIFPASTPTSSLLVHVCNVSALELGPSATKGKVPRRLAQALTDRVSACLLGSLAAVREAVVYMRLGVASASSNKKSAGKDEAPVPPDTFPANMREVLVTVLNYAGVQANVDGWKPLTNKEGVTIISKSFPKNPLTMVTGNGRINAPLEQVSEMIADLEKKKVYDPMFREGHIVEQINPQLNIVYQAFKAPWPTSPRDFCNLVGEWTLPDGRKLIAATTITSPKCPPVKGHVRAECLIGGFILTPVDGGRATHVQYLHQVDLKGSLPSSIVNMVAEKAPMCIAGMRSLLCA